MPPAAALHTKPLFAFLAGFLTQHNVADAFDSLDNVSEAAVIVCTQCHTLQFPLCRQHGLLHSPALFRANANTGANADVRVTCSEASASVTAR